MRPFSILVVDDEPDVRRMLEVVLGKRGHAVSTANSGVEALAQVQGERPDLILLDIMMEGMDGWSVLDRLKRDEKTRGIPVVILSARVEPRDKMRGLQQGAVDYLIKPFSLKEVLDRVEVILRSSSPH